jgi:hypothetical protein
MKWGRPTSSVLGFLRSSLEPAARAPLGPPCEGDRDVAGPAEQPVVLQAALAAAVRDGNDVVRLPTRARGAPGASRGAIGYRRFRAAPLTMRLDDVEAAHPACALVALLHLLPHVPRAAADLPFVHARVAAERPTRRLHGGAAPTADRVAGFIPLGLPPLIGGDDTLTMGTHGVSYRHLGRGSLMPVSVQLDGLRDRRQNAFRVPKPIEAYRAGGCGRGCPGSFSSLARASVCSWCALKSST